MQVRAGCARVGHVEGVYRGRPFLVLGPSASSSSLAVQHRDGLSEPCPWVATLFSATLAPHRNWRGFGGWGAVCVEHQLGLDLVADMAVLEHAGVSHSDPSVFPAVTYMTSCHP